MEVPHAVFGELKPKYVIITTCNTEFDVVFNGSKGQSFNSTWTRMQFIDWCNDICVKFNYTVTHEGVGQPPNTH